jgi:hypothetical protein
MNTITRIMGLPVSLVLLTGCTVNAPVHTDVHDNYVDVRENVVQTPDWKTLVPTAPANPLANNNPNAPQDIPDAWSSESVDPAPTFSPPSN